MCIRHFFRQCCKSLVFLFILWMNAKLRAPHDDPPLPPLFFGLSGLSDTLFLLSFFLMSYYVCPNYVCYVSYYYLAVHYSYFFLLFSLPPSLHCRAASLLLHLLSLALVAFFLCLLFMFLCIWIQRPIRFCLMLLCGIRSISLYHFHSPCTYCISLFLVSCDLLRSSMLQFSILGLVLLVRPPRLFRFVFICSDTNMLRVWNAPLHLLNPRRGSLAVSSDMK